MLYGGFISETFVTVGTERVRVTDIRELSGTVTKPPFEVVVHKIDTSAVVAMYSDATEAESSRKRIRDEWFDAVGVDDNGVALTEEGRRWQAQQPN